MYLIQTQVEQSNNDLSQYSLNHLVLQRILRKRRRTLQADILNVQRKLEIIGDFPRPVDLVRIGTVDAVDVVQFDIVSHLPALDRRGDRILAAAEADHCAVVALTGCWEQLLLHRFVRIGHVLMASTA